MRFFLIGLSAMAMVTGCDKLGMGGEGNSGPSMSGGSVGSTSTGDLPSTDGPGGSSHSTTSGGNPTTGVDTEACGTEDTAADPWGEGDGCGGGLPTHSPWDVGSGGSCWFQSDSWRESCAEAPCLDYDCHSPTLCGPVTFGECDDEPSGASDSGGGGDATTTGGPELEVDDPAALECILEALSNHMAFTYTITNCNDSPPSVTTYEVVSNGLVITTLEESWGEFHDRHQEISTFNDEYDYASCLGGGVETWEKRSCVGKSDNGPCPIGPVACPAE